MALMPCPDCNRIVSDIAPTCPECGRPIAYSPTQIEATAKRWKAVMLVGSLVFLIGAGWSLFATFHGSASIPAISTLGTGLTIVAVAQTLAWWFHG